MQTVINENLINYEVAGVKNKNNILILHGWKRSLKDWLHISKLLSYKNKVILVDLPGFGGSLVSKKVFDTYDYAKFIDDLIIRMKMKDVILIGHSFGGKIGTIVAANNKSIKKLILVDASGISEKSIATKIKILISKIISPTMKLIPKKQRELIFNFLASDDYKNSGPLKETFKKVISQNIESEAKKINCPTLIIWGDKDKEVSTNAAKKFKNLINSSTLRIVWNTGHDPFMEKPNKFLEILEEFIYV